MEHHHEESHDDSGSGSSVVIGKVCAMLVLGVASCVLGLLPVKLSTYLQNSTSGRGQAILQLLLCFGGGALLCTTFLHLLPEVRESAEELQESGDMLDTPFHLPEMIMCCGFFIMYLVEELIHVYLHHREKKAHLDDIDVAAHRSLSIRRCSSISSKFSESRRGTLTRSEDFNSVRRRSQDSATQEYHVTRRKSQDSITKKAHSPLNGIIIDGNLYDNADDKKTTIIDEMTYQNPLFSRLRSDLAPLPEINEENLQTYSNIDAPEGPSSIPEYENINKSADDYEVPRAPKSISSYCYVVPDSVCGDHDNKKDPHSGGHKMGHDLTHVLEDKDGVASAIRGLLVVLALSIHELFEGLAVGLQSTAQLVYYMMGAVAAHKLVISFCVGMELVSSGTRRSLIIIYVVAFAIVSPIGIGVGIAVSSDSAQEASEGAVNVVLQGLATGTLLYVVFFEILLKEREGGPPGLLQLLAILSGFGLMFGLLMAVSDDEGHGH